MHFECRRYRCNPTAACLIAVKKVANAEIIKQEHHIAAVIGDRNRRKAMDVKVAHVVDGADIRLKQPRVNCEALDVGQRVSLGADRSRG